MSAVEVAVHLLIFGYMHDTQRSVSLVHDFPDGITNIIVEYFGYLYGFGNRIKLNDGSTGIIKYAGSVHFNKDEQYMIGIELDQWSPNGHNGKMHGRKYFRAAPGCGIFASKLEIKKIILMNDYCWNKEEDSD